MKTKEITWDKQALVTFKDEAIYTLRDVWDKTYYRFCAGGIGNQAIVDDLHLEEIKHTVNDFFTQWNIEVEGDD